MSPDAVTMRDPSGLKAAEFTMPSWRRTAICLALAASQDAGSLVVGRRDDLRPAGAEGGGFHGSLMAAQHRDLLGSRGVPDAGGVVRHRDDARPVGAGSHLAVVAAQDRNLPGARGVPDAGGVVTGV